MDLFRFDLTSLDDGGDQQLLGGRGVAGEELARVSRIMPHGLASSPPIGSHGIGMAINGRRDQVAVLGLEDPAKRRRNVVAGGAVLYDAAGNLVYAKMTGGVEIKAADGSVEITRGDLKVIVSDTRIDLGGPGGFRVATQAGLSSKVFAIL